MSTRQLDIALIQHAMGPEAEDNRATTASGIAEAAELGAELVVLPELHASEYFCKYQDPALFDLAEPLDGPTARMLSHAAADHGVVVVGSIFEHRAAGLAHNTALVFERDGSLAGIYRKMHIPDDPGYNEKFYFTPGDLGFEPIDTSAGRLGVLVCWDQWYPEAARLMALAGAEVLLYPTAIGLDPDDEEPEQLRQLDAWRTIQRAHAVANGIPVATCNRVGFEPDRSGGEREAEFWGHSLVAGPQGEILAEAGSEAEVVFARVDLGRSEEVRRIWPFLRDRRIDAYGDLLKRWRN
ncbi:MULTISPECIES: carbon-nitrogen hydrolase [unclassified Wenzhouxiangella]|uniref:carbon-nitrogen hydrolase n=1 Tax=unclassified Wenzhouxiangella TaxID=2613841 RepID=UPI000E328602|nr:MULTISPECIES: carbon-nitrogen hydrolase [unclassified Wenzhouxiangella]RFF28681.1 acyltransferase [Wenzhouxiangella sp. 15181]RFP70262.1 acyltransferase [Wenzhouxiangella sp. 15190]